MAIALTPRVPPREGLAVSPTSTSPTLKVLWLRIKIQEAFLQFLALPQLPSVTIGKSLNLPEPLFPHL